MTTLETLRRARDVLADTIENATPGDWWWDANGKVERPGAVGINAGDEFVTSDRSVSRQDADLIVLSVNLAPTLLAILDNAMKGMSQYEQDGMTFVVGQHNPDHTALHLARAILGKETNE